MKICSACKKFKFIKILKGQCDYRLWAIGTKGTISERITYICTCRHRNDINNIIRHKVRCEDEM